MDNSKPTKHTSNSNHFNFFIKTSIYGTIAGFCALVVSHPLEYLKTKRQAESVLKIENVNSNKSLKSFLINSYSGFLPNLLRTCLKNVYRWPMMLFFPKKFNIYFNESVSKILTALTIANIECLIINPTERLKTYLMTKKDYSIYYEITNFIKRHGIKEYFRGMKPFVYRQNVSWLSFFYTDYYLKEKFYLMKIKNESNPNKIISKQLDSYELNIITICVALVNTAFGKYN